MSSVAQVEDPAAAPEPSAAVAIAAPAKKSGKKLKTAAFAASWGRGRKKKSSVVEAEPPAADPLEVDGGTENEADQPQVEGAQVQEEKVEEQKAEVENMHTGNGMVRRESAQLVAELTAVNLEALQQQDGNSPPASNYAPSHAGTHKTTAEEYERRRIQIQKQKEDKLMRKIVRSVIRCQAVWRGVLTRRLIVNQRVAEAGAIAEEERRLHAKEAFRQEMQLQLKTQFAGMDLDRNGSVDFEVHPPVLPRNSLLSIGFLIKTNNPCYCWAVLSLCCLSFRPAFRASDLYLQEFWVHVQRVMSKSDDMVSLTKEQAHAIFQV